MAGIYSINEIKDAIIPILAQYNIKKAILFGSYAKKCASEKSDIDLFIDSDGTLNGLNFFSVYDQLENRLNKKLDMFEAVDVQKGSPIMMKL